MITDQLIPNLQLPGATISRGQPYSGNGAEILEFPYMYLFDGTGLTDATNPTGNTVAINSDADFMLRRIVGLPTTASTLRLYDSSGSHWFQDKLTRMSDNYVFPREIAYPAGGVIRFDLGTVLRSTIACGENPIYTSYIGFQGVKRLLTTVPQYKTPFPYKRLPYEYTYPLTLNWYYYVSGTTKSNPRVQYLAINNYDFELHAIRVYLANSSRLDTVGYFQIQLFDAYQQQLSNMPIPDRYVDENETQSTTIPYNNVFPVPPLVYPANSTMRFDIRSMLCEGGDTYNIIIKFIGMQRYPV